MSQTTTAKDELGAAKNELATLGDDFAGGQVKAAGLVKSTHKIEGHIDKALELIASDVPAKPSGAKVEATAATTTEPKK